MDVLCVCILPMNPPHKRHGSFRYYKYSQQPHLKYKIDKDVNVFFFVGKKNQIIRLVCYTEYLYTFI